MTTSSESSTALAKQRRAAQHPDRPGQRCNAKPGAWTPIVDHARCEGKGDCIDVCPHDVFEIRRTDDTDFRPLPFTAKVKVVAHRRQTAYTPNSNGCRACGLCVVAYPEKALALVRS